MVDATVTVCVSNNAQLISIQQESGQQTKEDNQQPNNHRMY